MFHFFETVCRTTTTAEQEFALAAQNICLASLLTFFAAAHMVLCFATVARTVFIESFTLEKTSKVT